MYCCSVSCWVVVGVGGEWGVLKGTVLYVTVILL